MILESLGFMFFSTLEFIAIFSIMMSLFRFKTTEYIWPALFLILLMNMQSFVLRNDFSLAAIVPLISILIFIFLLTTVIKLPLIWSIICTILGYGMFAVIQTLLVELMFGSIAEAQATLVNGYMLQTVSAATTLLLSWILYRLGIGFSFDFDKLRLKFEDVIVVTLIIVFLITVSIILSFNEIWINVFFFSMTIAFLLFYSIKKEKSYD
ncbi:hypothetical protein [Paenibacillus crassostreae]|uniref:Uncharacterized protein n=1 Tax=Paenibacillus crassostreae TaxID=1763538 RepID=A0A167DMC8_9BACL|nr:hypothetical protein [Paenibacillus crassostreae]AOZ91283.1 hypothetical protein LPB68_03080 [Paenibacillus crassostreae]OAB74558.1 hypothetical protein PNBC_10880 [Paenibacillus crassostreae]